MTRQGRVIFENKERERERERERDREREREMGFLGLEKNSAGDN